MILNNFPDDTNFQSGTIITFKGLPNTEPKYALVSVPWYRGIYLVLDLYKRVGDCNLVSVKLNPTGSKAVSKELLLEWANKYIADFVENAIGYDPEFKLLTPVEIHIDYLEDYFTPENRNLKFE